MTLGAQAERDGESIRLETEPRLDSICGASDEASKRGIRLELSS